MENCGRRDSFDCGGVVIVGLKVCQDCGNPILDASKRQRLCKSCLKKHKKAIHLKSARALESYYKERGICPRCRIRRAEPDRVFCRECLEFFREYNKTRKKA